MRAESSPIRWLVLALVLVVSQPAMAGDGFLKHLDTLMRNYSESFYKDGSPGAIAEKWFRGGPRTWLSLKEMDATMKGYSEANQKVGEQAWTDLKACLSDLISFRTYLPSGLMEELVKLKARFLSRCEKPWADDGGSSGFAGEAESPVAMAEELSSPSGSIDARASSTHPPAKASAEDVARMNQTFDLFVRFQKAARRGVLSVEKRDAARSLQLRERLMNQTSQMEDKLLDRVSGNTTAITALKGFIDTIEPTVAKGCLERFLTRLGKKENHAALSAEGSSRARERSLMVRALRKKVSGR